MSQMVTRKGAVNEDKEKERGQTDSPVKEMKKKLAANAEKEKQAAEKADKSEKNVEKTEKSAEKSAEKKTEKSAEKKEQQPEKEKAKEDSKADKSAKSTEKQEQKQANKPESKETKEKQPSRNGTEAKTNGVEANGTDEVNGTVSDSDEDDAFPELAYEDTSDGSGGGGPASPERSATRRSQVKPTRTPETPRPLSGRQSDKEPSAQTADDSKDSKVLKMKEDPSLTDRRLRSADSPKPESKKTQDKDATKKTQDKPQEATKKHDKDTTQKEKEGASKKEDKETEDASKKHDKDKTHDKQNKDTEKQEEEVLIEIEDSQDEPRKTDTNYSKSRVKVSPYRRSSRLAELGPRPDRLDQTDISLIANYTGNNTTMEMDITESSLTEPSALDDSSYLGGLRTIRGRRSYKLLGEMPLRHLNVSRSSTVRTASSTLVSEQPQRPTGTVVGRKRKPDGGPDGGSDGGPDGGPEGAPDGAAGGKRLRLLERLAAPLRRTVASGTRRNPPIVGINTDLPLTAPISADTFDPETLKSCSSPVSAPLAPTPLASTPLASTPLAAPPASRADDRDNKRCIVM